MQGKVKPELQGWKDSAIREFEWVTFFPPFPEDLVAVPPAPRVGTPSDHDLVVRLMSYGHLLMSKRLLPGSLP